MKPDMQEIIKILNTNWEETETLTLKIYGQPEDIVRNGLEEEVSDQALDYVLREREIFFRETLEQLNKLSLGCLGCNGENH